LLTFTATASDPDLPADNLTFSLGNNAPAGAAIDPDTGVFTWQTTPADGQATYPITITVTDDGVPGLTTLETINVYVNLPPEVVNLAVNDGLEQRSYVWQLDLLFNDNVSATLSLADLVVENLDTATVIDSGDMQLAFDVPTLTATITFPGRPAGRLTDEGWYRVTVLAPGVNDPEGLFMVSDMANDFHVLQGDANGDRITNDLDLYFVWQSLLQPAMDRNPNLDLNGDGLVDSGDLSEVTTHYLATLTPPAPRIPRTVTGDDPDGNPDPADLPGNASAWTLPIAARDLQPEAEDAVTIPPTGVFDASEERSTPSLRGSRPVQTADATGNAVPQDPDIAIDTDPMVLPLPGTPCRAATPAALSDARTPIPPIEVLPDWNPMWTAWNIHERIHQTARHPSVMRIDWDSSALRIRQPWKDSHHEEGHSCMSLIRALQALCTSG
jgi:hypothetical protein